MMKNELSQIIISLLSIIFGGGGLPPHSLVQTYPTCFLCHLDNVLVAVSDSELSWNRKLAMEAICSIALITGLL